MPSLKTYDLFISHAWTYGEDYKRLIGLLDATTLFKYRNYSAPKDKPIVPSGYTVSDSYVRDQLDNKIRPVNAFIVISGIYLAHHDWMQTELNIAAAYHKPIIAIRPWGNTETPSLVQSQANVIVGWNTNSIVSAIRDYSI